MPVGPAADGAGQALVPLLVAGVAHGVVGVPAGGLPGTGGPGAAVSAFAAALEKKKARGQNCKTFYP